MGTTSELFTNPVKKQTEDYITGRYNEKEESRRKAGSEATPNRE